LKIILRQDDNLCRLKLPTFRYSAVHKFRVKVAAERGKRDVTKWMENRRGVWEESSHFRNMRTYVQGERFRIAIPKRPRVSTRTRKAEDKQLPI